ncbi:MAG: SatD family protein [Pseudomonadota bacterium]
MGFYVMLGDVVSSRLIKSPREDFQARLENFCQVVNATFAPSVYGPFKILKGADEVGGVLTSVGCAYGLISLMLERLCPHLIRWVLTGGIIDTAVGTHDVAKMDGPAFHKAAELMSRLKRTQLLFDMSAGDDLLDQAVAGQINLLLLLKGRWSERQRRVAIEYDKAGSQHEVAQRLGISQQAVSKTLGGLRLREIKAIEDKLGHILAHYPAGGVRG